ncbi:NAD-dependent epimerase/dehydratase family protein [soil metagenome]
MAEVAVIGANGFLGSHLVDALVVEGHTVTAFDRFRGGKPRFISDGVRLVPGEFLSRADLESAVAGQEYVFHFLSTTTPATAEADPTLDIRTNVVQSVELFEACVSAGVKQVYFASTGGAIYGDQGKTVYSEADRARPVSPYGIGKLTIEHYLRYFRTAHGLASTAFRISNPYGTRQPPGRRQGLIPIALRSMLAGEPVVRLGDGSMVRDYIFVEDVARALSRLVGRDTEYDLYNVGSGQGSTVTEIIDILSRVSGRVPVIEERPTPPTFVHGVTLDVSRFRAEFGDPAVTTLDDGARAVLEELLGDAQS